MAARGVEIPISVRRRLTYLHDDRFPLAPFLQKLLEKPDRGREVLCLPSFAMQEVTPAIRAALTWFDPLWEKIPGFEELRKIPVRIVPSQQHRQKLPVALGETHVLTPGVNKKVFHPRCRPADELPPSGRIRLLMVCSPLRRKGIDVVLRAYLSEFKASEKVELVLKLTHLPKLKKQLTTEWNDMERRLGALNADFPRVVVLPGIWEDGPLAGLMASSDVFIAANRLAYCGLTIREALACGLPVIGGYSLVARGMLPETGCVGLVAEQPITMPPGTCFAGSPELPAQEMVVEDLRRVMRELVNDGKRRKEMKQAAKLYSRSIPCWKEQTMLLKRLLLGEAR